MSTFVYDTVSREFSNITCNAFGPSQSPVTAMTLSLDGKTLYLAVYNYITGMSHVRAVALTSSALTCRELWTKDPGYPKTRAMCIAGSGLFVVLATQKASVIGEHVA
jgi:hypothetical protein